METIWRDCKWQLLNLLQLIRIHLHRTMAYVCEAGALNILMFGMTAKQWQESHPDLKGNIQDYANVSQLVCLSNPENLNVVFIVEGMSQAERLTKLNATAISQMEIL